MKINPEAIDRSGEIPTFFITPADMVFKNTVRCGWFGIFKEKREVNLRWIKVETSAGKSFAPVFENEHGYQIPNKVVSENYLECEIILPKIVSVTRHIHYVGNCSECKRFHMEDNGNIIMLVATEDQIEPEVRIEDDTQDLEQFKCSDKNCEQGWYTKTAVVR
jgi:hypothetical protein